MSIRTGARVNVDAAAFGKDFASKNRGVQISCTVVTRKSNGDLVVHADDDGEHWAVAEEYVHAVCEDDVMADEDEDEDMDAGVPEDDGDDEDVAAMKGVVMNDEDPGDADEEVVDEEAEPATRKRLSTGARKGEDRKARRARESRERAELRKKKDDFVAKRVAARTNEGPGADYEKEVQKLQDAIDEHYAGTIAGREAELRQQKTKDAAAKSAKLQTQIQELRKAPGRLSREERRKLEGLEEELEKERKKARGVKKRDEARAAKKRSEATSAVTKLRRELAKAVRERRAEDIAELEKELKKAERKVATLEANDRRTKLLDGLGSRLEVVVARTNPGTALAREAETCCTALTACRRLRRLDTSTEDEVLAAAVDALEKAQRGGGSLRDIVEKALEAMKSGGHGRDVGRKRRQSQEADQGVEDAEAALADAKRQRLEGKAGDDDVKEAEKALARVKLRQDTIEACRERSTVRNECLQRLEAIGETQRGSQHLANALQDATAALDVFVQQQRPVSKEETDALNKMMDVLANDKGAGVVKRRAEAIAALIEASAPSPWNKAQRREAAARDVADLEAELDALPEPDDVDHDEEARAKIEGELEKAKALVANLERNDELAKVADEISRELGGLKGSGTGDAAYEKSLDDADTLVAKFRGRLKDHHFDLSEAAAKLRDMLEALRDSPGRGEAARTARDAAVTKAREALMTYKEIATAVVDVLKELGEGAPAVCTYEKTKEALNEAPLGNFDQVCAIGRAARAEALQHVDALQRLRDDFGTLPRRDGRLLDAFVDDAMKALELLENRSHFLERREQAEEALSRLDGKFDALRGLRNEAAALDRFKAAASTTRTALGFGTASRYFAARERRELYDSVNEEEARLRDELKAFEETGGSGPAYDKELEKKRAAWKAAFDKTWAGRAAARWEARVRGAAGTLRLLTGDICSDARVLTDKGHPVCAKMKQEDKVIYVGLTWAGNVEAEAKKVIKRPNFLIKNDRGRPISYTQCEVVEIGVVDSKVAAILSERTLQTEIAGSGEYKPTDYAFSGRGYGPLTRNSPSYSLFVMGIDVAPGDQQRPSPCPRDGVVPFTAEFEAKIAAATAPPGSMPDERARGDLDVRMIKASPKRPVYHAYTRGPWSVHRWTKSRRAPFADEQRWLWPSADDARKWTQDKIDEKTSERGGYAIEDDGE